MLNQVQPTNHNQGLPRSNKMMRLLLKKLSKKVMNKQMEKVTSSLLDPTIKMNKSLKKRVITKILPWTTLKWSSDI